MQVTVSHSSLISGVSAETSRKRDALSGNSVATRVRRLSSSFTRSSPFTVTDLLVARIEQEIRAAPKRPLAPGRQLGIELSRRTRDLRTRDLEPTQLARDLRYPARRDALHVRLRDRKL